MTTVGFYQQNHSSVFHRNIRVTTRIKQERGSKQPFGWNEEPGRVGEESATPPALATLTPPEARTLPGSSGGSRGSRPAHCAGANPRPACSVRGPGLCTRPARVSLRRGLSFHPLSLLVPAGRVQNHHPDASGSLGYLPESLRAL